MLKRGPLSILIVENDLALSQTLSDYLKVFGFEALMASTVAEALQTLQDKPSIHIVIADLHLNNESGTDLLVKIKEKYADTPHVFIMSGMAVSSPQEFFQMGAEGFLPKTFLAQTLLEVVRKAMLSNRQRWSIPIGSEPLFSIADKRSGKDGEGFGFTLGRGGFCLTTDKELPSPGTPVGIDLQIGSLHIEGVVTLRWKMSTADNKTKAGFEFIYLEESSLNSVLTAIELLPSKAFIPAA